MNNRRCLAVLMVMIMTVSAFATMTVAGSDESRADPAGFATYFYDQLSEDEKVLYNMIGTEASTLTAVSPDIKGYYETFSVHDLEFPSLKAPGASSYRKILYAYCYDHPEVFWLRPQVSITFDNLIPGEPIRSVSLYYTVPDEASRTSEKERIDNTVSQIAIDGEFTYDKVKQIHDWIVGNVSYNTSAVGRDDAYDAHSIYGTFALKTCVCEGYAKAFTYLAQKNGINAIVSVGDGVTSSGSERHMWSYVQMEDGVWYCLDATWDDPLSDGKDTGRIYYDYFLRGTETKKDGRTFSESHNDTLATDFGLAIPVLSAKDYRFHPGETESLNVIIGPDSEGNLPYSYTLATSSIEKLREKAGADGKVIIRVQNGEFVFTCAEMKKVMEKLTADSVSQVEFSYASTDKTVKGFGHYEQISSILNIDADVKACTPSISVGITGLGLEEITLGLPMKIDPADISVFFYAWDISDPEHPAKIKADYSDGYETFTVSRLSTYCAGNNPLTPATDIPFLYLIAAAVLVIIILLLLIRHVIVGHGVKKRAKLMARSNRNMEHYGELYKKGELSSKERKAYKMARKMRKG